MKRFGLLVLTIALLALTSCATMFTKGGAQYRQGERALEAGDYVEAATLAIEALDKNPEFEDARALLDRAFTQGTRTWEQAVTDLESSDDEFAYDRIYPLYEKLDVLHSTVGASTHAGNLDVASYAEKIAAAKETAAEAHYQAGVSALDGGDFRSAREAVRRFQSAQRIVADYKDASDLEAEARELAKVTVMVYASSDPQTIFDQNFGTRVIRSAGVAEFTEVVDAGPLSGDAGLDEVIARADGADFVLYVTGTAHGEANGPTQSDPTEIYPDTIGYELTLGSDSVLEGSFQLFDVAAGETVVDDSLKVTHSDDITMRVFEPSSTGEYTVPTDHGEVTATFDVLPTTTDATGMHWSDSEIGEVITEAGSPYALDGVAVCIPEIELDTVRDANFGQLKSMLDGKAILPGVEVIVVHQYTQLPIYRYTDHYEKSGVEVMEEFSAKAAEIVDYFRTHAADVAQQWAQTGAGLSAKAAAQIAEKVASPLS